MLHNLISLTTAFALTAFTWNVRAQGVETHRVLLASIKARTVVLEYATFERFSYKACDYVHNRAESVHKEMKVQGFRNCRRLGSTLANSPRVRAAFERRFGEVLHARLISVSKMELPQTVVGYAGVGSALAAFFNIASAIVMKQGRVLLLLMKTLPAGAVVGGAVGAYDGYQILKEKRHADQFLRAEGLHVPKTLVIVERRSPGHLAPGKIVEIFTDAISTATDDVAAAEAVRP